MDLIKHLTDGQLKETVGIKKTIRDYGVDEEEFLRRQIKSAGYGWQTTFDKLVRPEATVIAKKHGGIQETFTVRRVSYGVGVEKTFPIHSPNVEKIEVVRKGKVRRAKLYYLRDRFGKAAKVKERV